MTAVAERAPASVEVVAYRRRRIRWGRAGLHVFLIAISLVWLFPLAYAVYTSLRPFSDTAARGYAIAARTSSTSTTTSTPGTRRRSRTTS